MIFENILINPSNKQKLILNKDATGFENLDTDGFSGEMVNGIPVILPKQANQQVSGSDVHQKADSNFNYLEHYQKDAELFDYFFEYDSAITRDENNRLHQSIINQIPKSAELILDVGCGNGWLNKAIVNDSTKVISMDISYTNPYKCLKNNPHKNHFGLVADVFNLPLAENSVDCIVASEIIEHVPNPNVFVNNLVKALKKGGKLIITTPYNEKLQYHLCVHCNKPTPTDAHIHSFNKENIKQLIPANITNWRYTLFSNKILIKLRIYLMLRFLPYKLWRALDKVAHAITGKSSRLMLIIEKK